MNHYFVVIAMIIFNAIAISMSIFSAPAKAQSLNNFVDLNQSRQFFDQGNKTIEIELKELERNTELPQIKLPEDYEQPQSINKSFLIERGWRLKPVSEPEVDNEQ